MLGEASRFAELEASVVACARQEALLLETAQAEPNAERIVLSFFRLSTFHPFTLHLIFHFVGKNDYFVDAGYHLVDRSVFLLF